MSPISLGVWTTILDIWDNHNQNLMSQKKQLFDREYAPSVKHSKTSVTCITGGNIALAASSRSAHQQGNRECHAPPEEAGSFKGGNL